MPHNVHYVAFKFYNLILSLFSILFNTSIFHIFIIFHFLSVKTDDFKSIVDIGKISLFFNVQLTLNATKYSLCCNGAKKIELTEWKEVKNIKINKNPNLEERFKEWYYKEKKKECTKMNIMVHFYLLYFLTIYIKINFP